eukprot:2748897-Amphidinium_carterae.1
MICKAVLDKPVDQNSMLSNLGARAYRRTIILVGGSATLWGMPPEWDIMVTRALAYFRKRNIQ